MSVSSEAIELPPLTPPRSSRPATTKAQRAAAAQWNARQRADDLRVHRLTKSGAMTASPFDQRAFSLK